MKVTLLNSADTLYDDELPRTSNGLIILPRYINAVMGLKVVDEVDLGTHGMFICEVTEARVISNVETMTYNYYQSNVKPKPETEGKKGWVCKVCGYVYDGEFLPEDIVCPLLRGWRSSAEERTTYIGADDSRIYRDKLYSYAS